MTQTMNTITGYKIKTRTKTIGTTVTSTAEPESGNTDKHKWFKAMVQQSLRCIDKQGKDFRLNRTTKTTKTKIKTGTKRQLEQQ